MIADGWKWQVAQTAAKPYVTVYGFLPPCTFCPQLSQAHINRITALRQPEATISSSYKTYLTEC
jgi:hypothetical protein